MVKKINGNWGRQATLNIYVALLLRLAIVLFLFFVSRFLFFALNTEYFPGITFDRWMMILKGGFRFDLAALLYVNSLYILLQILPLPLRYNIKYQKVARIIFFVTNGLALLANTIDFIYFRFTLRRFTLAVFDEFAHEISCFSLVLIIGMWY